MGYTHYIDAKRTLSKRSFKKITADVKVIEQFMKRIGQPLFDGGGENEGVEYSDSRIAFNGDYSKGDGHETMCITDWVFGGDSIKTARKPYDLAVVMTLLSIRRHCPASSIIIRTDGNTDDWKEAIDTFNELFPEVNDTFVVKKTKSGQGLLISANS